MTFRRWLVTMPRVSRQVVVVGTGPQAGPEVLLRLPVSGSAWAETIPPAPEGARVTVALSTGDGLGEHGDALAQLGYAVVGVRDDGDPDGPVTADFLVPVAALDRWPVWRDALAAAAEGVWHLEFGPARALLAAALAVHGR